MAAKGLRAFSMEYRNESPFGHRHGSTIFTFSFWVAVQRRLLCRRLFADDIERLFVGAQPKEYGMPHLAITRPLGKFYLANELGNKPGGRVLVSSPSVAKASCPCARGCIVS